ncbi:hypothetical protein BDV93DRAFT_515700 [Ceratobasidium sp. AG-I]|nr:hypothetical protein BDV93DRAFT_515700 [Ceratobasidium sp. AG-I]
MKQEVSITALSSEQALKCCLVSELNLANTTTVEFSFWTLQRHHTGTVNAGGWSGCTITNPENLARELEADMKCKSDSDCDVTRGSGNARSTISHATTQNRLNPDNWEEPATLFPDTYPPQARFWNYQTVRNVDICNMESR